MAAIYIAMELGYAAVHESVWDDDCPTRYFNTLDAFSHPENFVSAWNRPLFVILFAGPVQLGRWVIPVLMPLITMAGAWALWKGLRVKGVQNAWMIAPLYLLQSYVFGISRHALTEPLAATLICFGFLFLQQKKWLPYVIMGALLPLARFELAPLLLLWAWPLWQHKKVFIPLLGGGLLLWLIAAWMITGEIGYIFNSTLGQEGETSRYPHVPFLHYAERLIHVTGPVVFVLLLIGVVERFVRMRKEKSAADTFVFLQFFAGLLLYSIIAWKVNSGNPAGFLRNLVPLMPLAAILAFDGLSDMLRSLPRADQNESGARIRILVVSFVCLLCTLALFSGTAILRVDFFLRVPYLNALFVGAVILLCLMLVAVRSLQPWMEKASVLFLTALLAFFSFVIWPPDRFLSTEKRTVEYADLLISNSHLSGLQKYVNHIWYYWKHDSSPRSGKAHAVTQQNLKDAYAGSLLIWENHYSQRLGGDVDFDWIMSQPEWQQIFHVADRKGYLRVYVFRKKSNQDDPVKQLDEFITAQPLVPSALVLRAQLLMSDKKDSTVAEMDLRHSLGMEPDDALAHLLLGNLLQGKKQLSKALAEYSTSARLQPADLRPWLFMGECYEQLNELQLAKEAYEHVLRSQPKNATAKRGLDRVMAAMATAPFSSSP